MEKMTFADRLNLAMKERGFTQASLAEAVGMSQPSVWKLASGKSKSSRKAVQISNVLGVRPEWLTTGQEPMRDEANLDVLLNTRNTRADMVPTHLKIGVWEDINNQDMDEFVEIPLINVHFSAGPGTCEIIEDESFTLIFRSYSLHKMGVSAINARLVRISGNSMYPSLNDGDIVGINMADTAIKDGKTYAICHDDMLRIKMLTTHPGKIIIRSVNRDEYPDEIMDRQIFLESVKIIGKVFWSAHMW